jgi:hypothetical protein
LTDEWAGAKSIGQAISVSTTDGTESNEVRYYISSREAKVADDARERAAREPDSHPRAINASLGSRAAPNHGGIPGRWEESPLVV